MPDTKCDPRLEDQFNLAPLACRAASGCFELPTYLGHRFATGRAASRITLTIDLKAAAGETGILFAVAMEGITTHWFLPSEEAGVNELHCRGRYSRVPPIIRPGSPVQRSNADRESQQRSPFATAPRETLHCAPLLPTVARDAVGDEERAVSSRGNQGRGAVPPPPQSPYPPRPPSRGDNWTPNAFSPAIFLVALLVIAFLVAAAYFSQRGRGETPAVPSGGATAAAPNPTGAPAAATATAGSAGAPTPTGAARSFVVANTGGDGVYLRRTPRLADRDTAYPDGTRLVAIGPDVTGDGQSWRHVRTPDGKTGYIPAQYTTEATR